MIFHFFVLFIIRHFNRTQSQAMFQLAVQVIGKINVDRALPVGSHIFIGFRYHIFNFVTFSIKLATRLKLILSYVCFPFSTPPRRSSLP